jgi:cobyrinic acid a,c-diamide synthase
LPHLLISAAHKSSGKTTATVGICAALRDRGLAVQPFKKGPDYIDPLWLGEASGRPCHNLDFYTMSETEILGMFARYSTDADIAVIEGNKGLYDGLDLLGSNSNAALAELLRAPVVLVIDARGVTRGIAPLILGYQAFDPNICIAGVILNRLGGRRHESKLRAVIEHYTDARVVGAVYDDPALEIVERHLGLMPSNESAAASEKIATIGRTIAGQVDLDALLELARDAPDTKAAESAQVPARVGPDVRIGVMRDAAFGFYYPDDLSALENAGAQLVFLDALHDQRLPDLDGLFIGGGFPEVQMEALQRNASLRQAIRRALEAGLPGYAECGGLMYLARSITWNGRTCEMVGVIPGDVVMHAKPQGRGYVRLRETSSFPWPRLSSAPDGPLEIYAHEFHYSKIEQLAPSATFAYEVLRGVGVDGEHDGILVHRTLASYTHLRDVAGNHWAARFVRYVRDSRIGAARAAASQ